MLTSMARHDDSKSRVTPKGTQTTQPKGDGTGAPGNPANRTPVSVDGPSPVWVPVMMFGFLALGVATILLNYLGVLPGSASNWYLLGGLGMVLAGIFTATQYR